MSPTLIALRAGQAFLGLTSLSLHSPESLRTRNDVFYLQPERSCIAESPLWYSVIPMDRSMLESMLNRILVVREIYEEHSRLSSLEDDMD